MLDLPQRKSPKAGVGSGFRRLLTQFNGPLDRQYFQAHGSQPSQRVLAPPHSQSTRADPAHSRQDDDTPPPEPEYTRITLEEKRGKSTHSTVFRAPTISLDDFERILNSVTRLDGGEIAGFYCIATDQGLEIEERPP